MRKFRIVTIGLGIAVLMTQYQNCARPSSGDTDAGGGVVHAVDNLSPGSLQFPMEEVQLASDAQAANVGGLCSQSSNGQSLTWAISSQDRLEQFKKAEGLALPRTPPGCERLWMGIPGVFATLDPRLNSMRPSRAPKP